ncbi:MAG: hypothetical protein QW507_02445 [Candidatus Nanoarchaeia archaeon]|nr:hypothetical protein [Candidatus Haiyanarchaeum thermophilum]MCW1303280.1 hypothetical protein [Candidatus Haiyanarchaeum thermophilum]MCW1303988.1 hypothetical protein [Candidatus Haiyanarchaeum thermophilum]MCW1306439.1 hypothetical protein [Candidatus Haiyanarchaeum thermophilum]MCW1307263.1 hypothetical protein [Candidatus Haiyanarchaeum thermophilum]
MAEKETLKWLYNLLILGLVILVVVVIAVVIYFSIFQKQIVAIFNDLSYHLNIVCRSAGSTKGMSNFFLPANYAIVQIYKDDNCNNSLYSSFISHKQKFSEVNMQEFLGFKDIFGICLVEFSSSAALLSLYHDGENYLDENSTQAVKIKLSQNCVSISSKILEIKSVLCKPIGCFDIYIGDKNGYGLSALATTKGLPIHYLELENFGKYVVPILYISH